MKRLPFVNSLTIAKNLMFETRHFVTGNFESHAKFVDDATYSTILDNVVKATCDVFITRPRLTSSSVSDLDRRVLIEDANEDVEILLGERVGLPHADWWIPGGRVMPGETVDATARRVLRRELKLDIGEEPGRVRTVAHYTFVWDTRTQEPIHNGTCDVSIILRVDLTREESERVEFISKEYKQLEWRTLASQAALPPGSLHPALEQGVKDLCAMREWERVQTALDAVENVDGADSTTLRDIVKRLKKFSELKAVV